MNEKNMQIGAKRVLDTDHLVSLPVRPENIFHFPGGLPAFETVHEFVFLCPPGIKPFFIMQSLEPRDLAFVCIDPFLVCPGYNPVIREADVKALDLAGREDVFLFSIVTVRRDVRETTANLQGPVVVNIRTGNGRQILCHGKEYPVRYGLWEVVSRLQGPSPANEVGQPNHRSADQIIWPRNRAGDRQPVCSEVGKET